MTVAEKTGVARSAKQNVLSVRTHRRTEEPEQAERNTQSRLLAELQAKLAGRPKKEEIIISTNDNLNREEAIKDDNSQSRLLAELQAGPGCVCGIAHSPPAPAP